MLRHFVQPSGGDGFVCIKKAVLLTPHGVSRFGFLGDAFFAATEDKTDVMVRVLLLHQQMLLAICGQEAAFSLYDDSVLQNKVRGVTRDSCRLQIVDNLVLVCVPNASSIE